MRGFVCLSALSGLRRALYFNADSMGKLYCLLEEANPGNSTRNNNQLKGIITGGRKRIERKGVGAFHVDCYRSFISCSQGVPFKIEQGDRRLIKPNNRLRRVAK